MRKRVTFRPGRTQALIAAVVALGMAILGAAAIAPMMGLFGVIWTVLAASISAYHFYMAFGKRYVGPEIHIEEEAGSPADVASRLRQLEALRDQKLITEEEYAEKRQLMLRDL